MKMMAKTYVMVALVGAVFAGRANAGLTVSFVSEPADIRVWVDRGAEEARYDMSDYDVYPSMGEVALFVRASRNCYATVYVVDTEGYIHVVEPLFPYENAFLRGGRLYRIDLCRAGFSGSPFEPGVAYAFAVSSPVPFDYSAYGIELFAGGRGVQIFGDPYVASRMFYQSILPARCQYGLVGVSYARFYVRQYVRYPAYLCVGWHDHYGVRQYCRGTCSACRSFHVHTTDPYRVLRPTNRMIDEVATYTRIVNSTRRYKGRSATRTREFATDVTNTKFRTKLTKQMPDQNNNVVRSSKETFVKAIKDYSAMREQHDNNTKKVVSKTQKHPQSGSKSTSVARVVKTATATKATKKSSGGKKSTGTKGARQTSSTKKAQKKR